MSILQLTEILLLRGELYLDNTSALLRYQYYVFEINNMWEFKCDYEDYADYEAVTEIPEQSLPRSAKTKSQQ